MSNYLRPKTPSADLPLPNLVNTNSRDNRLPQNRRRAGESPPGRLLLAGAPRSTSPTTVSAGLFSMPIGSRGRGVRRPCHFEIEVTLEARLHRELDDLSGQPGAVRFY